MNTPTPTPRTDAARTASFDVPSYGAGGTARAMRDECVKLEKELRQLRADVQFVIDHANKASQGDQQCSELWMAEQLGCALDVTEPPPLPSSAEIDAYFEKIYAVNPDAKQRELTVTYYGNDASFARFKRAIRSLAKKRP